MNSSNPAADANAVLPRGHSARVLEPSPPAIIDEWFADDPTNAVVRGQTVVSPVSHADMTWSELVVERPELSEFASDPWLRAYRRVRPTPVGYQRTLLDLHRLAMAVIAPARQQVNGKFGLRRVHGGFGSPCFGDDEQVRVIGDQLVIQKQGVVSSAKITTMRAAAAAIGSEVDVETASEPDSPEIGSLDETLHINPTHAAYLSDWWGLGTAALEAVRNDSETVAAGRLQLWPGHFDLGIEFGTDAARASFGASPGDHNIDEPYLYVAVWHPDRVTPEASPYWNASAFKGAIFAASQLVGIADPVAAAVAFFVKGRDLLAAGVVES